MLLPGGAPAAPVRVRAARARVRRRRHGREDLRAAGVDVVRAGCYLTLRGRRLLSDDHPHRWGGANAAGVPRAHAEGPRAPSSRSRSTWWSGWWAWC